ncbi:MAG: hypothetical protein AB7P31_07460 [Steroidobacteraceae bacterium]
MKPGKVSATCFAALVVALSLAACTPRETPAPQVPVTGGNVPPMPPLPAAQAQVEAAALEGAAIEAQQHGANALLVVRNSHVIFERYWHGTTFSTPIGAGAWQGVIDDLLAGALVEDRKPLHGDATPDRAAIARAAGVTYEAYLAKRLWRPIGAFDAVLAPRLRAAQGDWLRIGELLANDGVYLGEEIVRPGWTRQVLERHAVAGAAPPSPATKDLYHLPGADGASLWVVPSLRLVILRTGGEIGAGDGRGDARIPELVLRGVMDRPRPTAGGEGTPDPAIFVPAH